MGVTGKVVSTSPDWRGDTLVADALATDTVLVVNDAVDFDDTGGWLVIADESEPREYVTCDYDAQTVTLTAALGTAVEADMPVITWDPDAPGEHRVVEHVAIVELDGDGGSCRAVLDHSVIPSAGIDNLVGASVEITDDGDDVWVIAVRGRQPVLDGTYIDPGTLPAPDQPTEAPATSPALTVAGTVDGLVVKAEEVDSTTLIAYHITDAPPLDVDGNPLDFTTDATTLLGQPTTSRVLVVTHMPDGSALKDRPIETPYYLRTVASNVVGEAPPSAQVTAQRDPDNVAEIITQKVTTGEVEAGAVRVGNLTILPGDGLRIPQSDGGMTHLPDDGSESTMTGAFRMRSATIDDHLTVNGTHNKIAGSLDLSDGVTAPGTSPAVGRGWSSVLTGLAEDTVVPPASAHGLVERIDDSNYWITVRTFLDDGDFRAVHKVTGALDPFVFPEMGGKFTPSGGVARVGNRYYVLGQDHNRGGDWYVYEIGSGFGKISEWAMTSFTPSHTPAIGPDEVNGGLVVAWTNPSGTLYVRHFTTAGVAGATPARADYGKWNLGGVYRGLADFGGDRIIVARRGADPESFFSTTLFPDAANGWPRAESSAVHGMVWDGVRFRHLDGEGRVWDYALNAGGTVNAAFSLRDSDPAGTGTHETEAGPARAFDLPARSRLTVSTDTPVDTGQPDDPDSVRIYIDDHRQPDLAVGEVSAEYDDIDFLGAASPTSNGFVTAESSPGRVVSTATGAHGPLIELQGDGEAWIEGKDAWHTITPSNGYVADGTAVPRYRIDPTGRVELRGIILMGTAANAAVAFNLPAGYRISGLGAMEFFVVVSPPTDTGRVRVEPDGDVILSLNTGTPDWYRLDGITFSTI